MEAPDGILSGLSAGKIWAEMSTTDEAEAALRLRASKRCRRRCRRLSCIRRLPPCGDRQSYRYLRRL